MEKFLGLRTTIYKVPDIHKAKDWYSLAFGKCPYFDQDFYVGFNIGGYELGLIPESRPVQRAANVVAYWGVENVQEAYEGLLQLGALPCEKPENVGGEIVVASVKDPFGNVIGIISNPGFKAEEKTVPNEAKS